MNPISASPVFHAATHAPPPRRQLDEHTRSLTDPGSKTAPGGDDLRDAFQDFVGQTLFGSMLASMRKTVGKPAYMHGGRTEEVFQQQLDQILIEDISEASASTIADPMYELFNLQRRAS